ncbi:hypothetical protein HK097_010277 [Rhizophlyctis rosea]|uniref:NAD(P)-binding protein n=1 Tax=Rhizophlyctis rosea TaxID=64517 RepID=A0AAD5SHG6_9FUNG|nr:hypothetical protein HK097_010277 [Rhizophlyctis rosea]
MPATDQVVLVTGASKGLGLAIARFLLSQGAKVLGTSRSLSSTPDILSLTNQYPQTFQYLPLDLTTPNAAQTLVTQTLSHFHSLTAIIHNAGGIEPLAKVADANLEEWKKLFDLNFFSGIDLIQHSLPYLRTASANGGGRIVVVSSGAAARATAGWGPYCTSKAAVNMLVAGLGLEEKEVTTIAVRPGVVETEMQDLIRAKGEQAMDAETYNRFTTLKKEEKLLPPELPGTAIAKLALAATKDFSGQFVNWDDERIGSL